MLVFGVNLLVGRVFGGDMQPFVTPCVSAASFNFEPYPRMHNSERITLCAPTGQVPCCLCRVLARAHGRKYISRPRMTLELRQRNCAEQRSASIRTKRDASYRWRETPSTNVGVVCVVCTPVETANQNPDSARWPYRQRPHATKMMVAAANTPRCPPAFSLPGS